VGLHLKLTEFISLHTAAPAPFLSPFSQGGEKIKKYNGNLFLCHSRQPQKATQRNAPTAHSPNIVCYKEMVLMIMLISQAFPINMIVT